MSRRFWAWLMPLLLKPPVPQLAPVRERLDDAYLMDRWRQTGQRQWVAWTDDGWHMLRD